MPPRGTLRVIDAAEEFVSIVGAEFAAVTKTWPFTDQLRRAAGSVFANLVEGHGRGPGADRVRLYRIAKASCEEALGWLRQARDAGVIEERAYFRLYNRGIVIVRMINQLMHVAA
jgi:four helix bundle protein